MTPLNNTLSRHLTQGAETERAVLQAPRQTPGVKRVRAQQPAGAGRVHRGHAGAAGRVVAIVRQSPMMEKAVLLMVQWILLKVLR